MPSQPSNIERDTELREELAKLMTGGVHIYELEDPFMQDGAVQPEFPARWASDVVKDVDSLHDFIKAREERLVREAFKQGQRVGQYQTADKLYGHVTTMWTFRDDNIPELNMPDLATDLLRDCEKFLNHNRKVYVEYVKSLPQQGTQDSHE